MSCLKQGDIQSAKEMHKLQRARSRKGARVQIASPASTHQYWTVQFLVYLEGIEVVPDIGQFEQIS